MMRGRWGTLWFNLALVLLILLPVWMALQYVVATLLLHPGADPHWLSGALAIYVILALPLIVGGVLQNLILLAIPPGWPPLWRRLAAIVSSAVMPLTILLLAGGHPGYLADPYTAGPFCVALVVYGSFLRLPPGRAQKLGGTHAMLLLVVGAAPWSGSAQSPGRVADSARTIPAESLGLAASQFRCATEAPIERLSGAAVAHGILCMATRSDTSYAAAFTADHHPVWRVTSWQVPSRAVDSVLVIMEQRIDREHGPGRSCGKGEIRYWGSPPRVWLLSVARQDLPTLSAEVALTEGVDAPTC